MTLRSSLYVGSVMHRRIQPRMHRFRYQAFWLLLDLDELDEPSSKLRWFSHNRSNIFSFHDADHGDVTFDTDRRVSIGPPEPGRYPGRQAHAAAAATLLDLRTGALAG